MSTAQVVQKQKNSENDQATQEMDKALKSMEDAFHEFHETIVRIHLEQKEIAREIRQRIDKDKIERIYNMLQQS